MKDGAPDCNENPYASPMEAGEVAERFPAELWRFDDLIVAHRKAVWPNLCVKTAAPCSDSVQLAIASQYPSWLLLPLFGVPWLGLVFSLFFPKNTLGRYLGLGALAVVAVSVFVSLYWLIRMTKRTTIVIFVSRYYFAQRRQKLWIASVLTALGLVGLVVSLLLLMPFGGFRLLLFLGSIAMAGAGASYRAHWKLLLRPTKTKSEYIVLRGAGQAFLRTLKPWPYGPI